MNYFCDWLNNYNMQGSMGIVRITVRLGVKGVRFISK